MNILKTLRNGVHATDRNGDSPPASSRDAKSQDVSRDAQAHEQPLVVGNGLPIKTKAESGLSAGGKT